VSAPNSRLHLPDEWAEIAHCPVCDNSPLIVVHANESSDRLSCARCGTVHEVEKNGNRVFLVILPNVLPADMTHRWMTPEEVHTRVQVAAQVARESGQGSSVNPGVSSTFTSVTSDVKEKSVSDKPVLVKPVPAFTTKNTGPLPPPPEVINHAQQLYAMGNSPTRVRSILDRSHTLTPAQLDAAMAPIEKSANWKRAHNRNGVIIAVAVLLIMMMCTAIAVLILNPRLGIFVKSLGDSSAQTILDRSQLPEALQTMVPPGQRLLTQSTPMVIPQPARASEYIACPNYAIEAAQLFGGSQDRWSKENNNWVMFMPGSVDIFIPAGMQADYFIFGINTQSKTVLGPVKIRNVYLININCGSH
jgi:hypothetical protein